LWTNFVITGIIGALGFDPIESVPLRLAEEAGMPENIMSMLNNIMPTIIFPILTLSFLIVFYLYYIKISKPKPGTTEWIDVEMSKPRLTFLTVRHPLEKRDIVPLVIITVVFLFLALFRLGDTVAPQSFFQFSRHQQDVIIELDEPEEISSLMFYTGLWTGYYKLEFSEDHIFWYVQNPVEVSNPGGDPTPAMDQSYADLFKWRYASLSNSNPVAKFIRITASRTPIELGEIALFDSDGRLIPRERIINPGAYELFDEQELVPDRPSYMNSMYFDEVYHGRTALEHLRSIRPYERTHPPLGKEIIAASADAAAHLHSAEVDVRKNPHCRVRHPVVCV
jgi:hypothetical protein